MIISINPGINNLKILIGQKKSISIFIDNAIILKIRIIKTNPNRKNKECTKNCLSLNGFLLLKVILESFILKMVVIISLTINVKIYISYKLLINDFDFNWFYSMTSKDFIKNSKWLIILYNIYTNLKSRLYTYTGIHKTTSGSILQKKKIRKSIEYINSVYKDYVKYGNLKSNDLREKVILEIGPGDNFGVALNFLMDGASKVICIDKFYSSRLKDDEFKFYLNFRNELSESKKMIFDKVLELDSHIKLNQKKLEYHFGIGIEDALKLLKLNSIDIIVSRSVLEHIHYIDAAMHTINKILVPGGLMIHKIDLRDHRMFSSKKFHHLEFLTIPRPLYNLMTKYSGKPNRKLMDYYFYKIIDLGYNFKILITSIVGNENELEKYIEFSSFNYKLYNKANNLVEEIRPFLCREFRTMSKKNLMVSGLFLIAKKPS